MTYVFVLVSDKDDLYYEQALMAAWSFRLYNKFEKLVLLTDNRTAESFIGRRTALKKLCSKIITVNFDEKVSNVERSRLIKTAIPEYIDDDFLYMDCDIIVCESLREIEKTDITLGGVLDGHVTLDEHIHKDAFLRRDKKLGFTCSQELNCNFNGGLVFARQGEESKQLFKTWNDLWKFSAYEKHDFHDQPPLNEAVLRNGKQMQELSGIWNCQPSHGGLEFLGKAKIIHYYSSEFGGKNYVPYYKLADKNLQMRIKEEGEIPEDVQQMIRNAKFQFNKVHIVNDRRIIAIMQSPLVFTLAEMKAKIPVIFNGLDKAAYFFRESGKKILRK